MAEEGQRKNDKVEDAKGLRSGTQHTLVEYFAVSDGDEATLGVEKQDFQGHLRGVRDGENHQTRESRRYVQVGSDGGRCSLLDQGSEGYSCYHCRGGLDFEYCKATRGMKK